MNDRCPIAPFVTLSLASINLPAPNSILIDGTSSHDVAGSSARCLTAMEYMRWATKDWSPARVAHVALTSEVRAPKESALDRQVSHIVAGSMKCIAISAIDDAATMNGGAMKPMKKNAAEKHSTSPTKVVLDF